MRDRSFVQDLQHVIHSVFNYAAHVGNSSDAKVEIPHAERVHVQLKVIAVKCLLQCLWYTFFEFRLLSDLDEDVGGFVLLPDEAVVHRRLATIPAPVAVAVYELRCKVDSRARYFPKRLVSTFLVATKQTNLFGQKPEAVPL